MLIWHSLPVLCRLCTSCASKLWLTSQFVADGIGAELKDCALPNDIGYVLESWYVDLLIT